MSLYILACIDRTDSGDLRARTKEQHLAYLPDHMDMIRVAGPLYDADQAMIGSLYILEAQDRATVERFQRADPYAQAGLFAQVEIWPWKVTVNRLFG